MTHQGGMAAPFPRSTDPVAATDALAARAGLPQGHSRMAAAAATLAAAGAALGPASNAGIALRPSHDIAGVAVRRVYGRQVRTLTAPLHLSGMPDCFTPHSAVAHSPDFDVLAIPGGYLMNLPNRPVIVTGHGDTVVSDYGTVYAGLLHYYDFDLRQTLSEAQTVNGTLISIADDVWPLNFCHWMVDWLPRLAALGELASRPSTFVAVPPLDAAYQWDTLRLCGFPPERVVQLRPWQAVRARHLLAPSDLQAIPHPGHKAAPWLLTWLRATLGYGALVERGAGPLPRGKLYVSRGSAPGRRVVNEDALRAVLEKHGYRSIDPNGMPIVDQIAAFAGATHIVAPHGAALASVAFGQPSGSLLELFPPSYGTAAYYVLSAGLGASYASYIAHDIVPGARSQLDDLIVDIPDFLARCEARL
jgi:capsular polysaccharide biosynthesis protein